MTVQICPDKDAACDEFAPSMRCVDCPTVRSAGPDHVARDLAACHAQNRESIASGWRQPATAAEYWLRVKHGASRSLFSWSDIEQAFNAGMAQAAQPAQPSTANGGKTGWPPGLLQDDCHALSRWLSSRPDAMYQLRKLYSTKEQT